MTLALYPARYSDGRTARVQAVRASLDTGQLLIFDDNGGPLDTWPLDEVRLLGEPDDDGIVRVCRADGDARLTIGDAQFLASLKAAARNLRRPVSRPSVRGRRIVLWTVGAVLSVGLFFFVIVPFFAREAVRLIPPTLEARIGAVSVEQVIELLADKESKRQGKALCQTPEGKAMLDRIVAALSQHAKLPYPLVVQIVNSKHVNALALPGGQILMLRGLIDFALHPHEIAGILAHEIAHIEFRHPFQIAIERTSGALMVGLLFGDAVSFSVVGAAVSTLVQGYYSRDMEAQADERGLELMRAAGFTTAPLAGFFDRVAKREAALPSIFSVLSTHPDSGGRAARTRGASSASDQPLLPIMPHGEWREWLALRRVCE